jgi:hypothetical protein
MASVELQVIPPELETAAGRVLTPKKRGGSTVTHTTARKGSKKSTRKKPPAKDMNDFTQAARVIAKRMEPDRSLAQLDSLIRKIIRELKAGIFDEAFWTEAVLLNTAYLTAYPSSVPDENPPPYNYRTSANAPTIPTYGNGTIDTGPARYAGSKHVTYFMDDSLTWARFVYKPPVKIKQGNLMIAFAVISGNITVTAASRASKPMLSLISAGSLTNTSDPDLYTEHPITDGIPASAPTQTRLMQSHYWRYKIPKSTPPYYSRFALRPIVRNMVRSSTITLSPQEQRAVLLLAPRPMFGRGYNNNNWVNTSFEGTPKIYFLLPEIPPQNRTVTYVDSTWPEPVEVTGGKEYRTSYLNEVNDSIVPTLVVKFEPDEYPGVITTRDCKASVNGMQITLMHLELIAGFEDPMEQEFTVTMLLPDANDFLIKDKPDRVEYEEVQFTRRADDTSTDIDLVAIKYSQPVKGSRRVIGTRNMTLHISYLYFNECYV